MDARQRLKANRNKKQVTNKRSVNKGKGPGPVRGKKGSTVSKAVAGKGATGKKNAAQPTKTLTRKISDLRQIIAAPRPTISKQTISQKKSAIKQRLGLQSKSARERIRNANVAAASRNQTRVAKATSSIRPQGKKRPGGSFSNAAGPTIIIAQSPASNAPAVLTSGTTRASGYSVIVSNLNPAVTQSDILELFGDVGSVKSYQNINSTTAMVTFSQPQEASAAVQTYNNRLLDGQPMQVTLIPAPAAPQMKRVSQAFRRVFSRGQ